MIIFTKGDIFQSQAEALVNPVNCVGVMGAGLAAEFKKRYPVNFTMYKNVCDLGALRPGRILSYEQPYVPPPDPDPTRYILNFPTKVDWRNPSELHYIKLGLLDLANFIDVYQIKSIAIPALGCGEGKLSWSDVKPILRHYLRGIPHCKILIYWPLK